MKLRYSYLRSQIETVWSSLLTILTRTCGDGRFIYNACNNNRHVSFNLESANTLCPFLFAQHFLYIYGISIFLGIKAMLIRMTYIKIFETPMSASNSICILMLNDLSCSINAVLLLEQCNLLHLKWCVNDVRSVIH